MLLPLPESAARDLSLAQHLTFVACKGAAASAYLVNELIRLVYLTFYVQNAGYGDTDLLVYASAEASLERCLTRAERKASGNSMRPIALSSKRFCARPTRNSNARRATA
ncbi:hypothetical protein [Burkholderia gladioli]|uniref:hypothetical protein n=1 Tax=Burkholderia gladioli TaxID=28095 RepID=UPI00069502F2|nr:hypothetical protein [Burkholderia gladioli]